MHRLALQRDLALVGNDRTGDGFDERRLASAVVTDHGKDFVAPQLEVGIVQGDYAAVAFVEARGPEDDIAVAHAEIFLIHWSIVTATMIRTPTAKSCQSNASPDSARP